MFGPKSGSLYLSKAPGIPIKVSLTVFSRGLFERILSFYFWEGAAVHTWTSGCCCFVFFYTTLQNCSFLNRKYSTRAAMNSWLRSKHKCYGLCLQNCAGCNASISGIRSFTFPVLVCSALLLLFEKIISLCQCLFQITHL